MLALKLIVDIGSQGFDTFYIDQISGFLWKKQFDERVPGVVGYTCLGSKNDEISMQKIEREINERFLDELDLL